MTGRFDEHCPHCEARIEALYDCFVGSDYRTTFSFACPHCGEPICVDVHTVPEFELTKPQDISRRDRYDYNLTPEGEFHG